MVSGTCKEISIVKIIGQTHPKQSKEKNISYAQLVKAMILNGLGFVDRTLHLYPEYYADRAIERLLGKLLAPRH